MYKKYLKDQKGIDEFLIKKCYSRNNNPFYIGFLKAYLNCFELPFKVTKSLKKGQNQRKKPTFLTKEQIDTIIKHTSPQISLLTRLFFETGGRLREIINATWDDIRLEEREIIGIGKHNKPFTLRFSMKTARLLQKYLEKPENQKDHPFHFTNSLDPGRSFYYFLRKECKKLGIENVHPHRLRHSIGYYLRSQLGWDMEQVRVFLRHTKLETTRIYSTATEEEIKKKTETEVFQDG